MKENFNKTQNTNYITSSRAAQLSGYSQDYVGQLCRGASIECKRVSGEWHVSLSSLLSYKKRFSPERGIVNAGQTVSSSINEGDNTHQNTIEGPDGTYISSSDAAKRTGYSQDYIGQLARSGAVTAKKIGRKWFIEQNALEQHKAHNDKLLAAVQADSAGIQPVSNTEITIKTHPVSTATNRSIPVVTYKHDDGSLVPEAITDHSSSDTHEPEIRSMPSFDMPHATSREIPRRDLRAKSNHLQNISKYRHKNQSQLIDIVPISHTKPIVSSIEKILISFIFLFSLTIIATSLLSPEILRNSATNIAGTVNLSLDDSLLKKTVIGKKALHIMSATIHYKKAF